MIVWWPLALTGVIVMLTAWFRLREHRRQPKTLISLLVPFRADFPERGRNWYWLEKYWAHELPEAEIVMGSDDHVPFCKTAAVNDAFRKSHGDIVVILDADCYISGDTIRLLAGKMRRARRDGHRLWFIPYRRFYRLTEEASVRLLSSRPEDPIRFPDPPPFSILDTPTGMASGSGVSFGHWFGALIQMMPREAFTAARGMDERFAGWGGEDISFMHAVDTMWGRHKTHDGPVYHIHHPVLKGIWAATRQWIGQDKPEINDRLSQQYTDVVGDRVRMDNLIGDGWL